MARRVLLGLLAAAVVAGGGTAAVLARPPAAEPVAAPAPVPSRGPLLTAVDGTSPVPSPAGVTAVVDAALADPALGGRLAASVVDLATGDVLHERSPDVPLVPASTAKVVTGIAALTALDDDAVLTTRVLAGAAPGEVVLVGGGDTTLSSPAAEAAYPPRARLAELAGRVRRALGGVPVTKVVVDDRLYSGDALGPGWRPGYVSQGAVAPVGPLLVDGGRVRPDRVAREADPALAAGRALAAVLQPGAPVVVERGAAAPGAEVLGSVDSPPVRALVERMLSRSDNDLAEALVRQVALATGRPASFAGAAEAVREVLAPALSRAGVDPSAVALVDGSGLSRDDRLTPAALTSLLALVVEDPDLAPVLAGLPVAGFTGTLSDRYRADEDDAGAVAAGQVRAKTGTLAGVSALAGVLRTDGGRVLAFALLADGVPAGGTLAAEAALDRLAAALARCGC